MVRIRNLFFYKAISMQTIAQEVVAVEIQEPVEEANEPPFDFTQCQMVKKLTTHDIYRIKQGNKLYIIKSFAYEAEQSFTQEVTSLTLINHPNVPKIVYQKQANQHNQSNFFWRHHLVVSEECERGDLNDYIPKYGKMTQKLAKTIFKQIVEVLNYAAKLKPCGIIHPNLVASSVLIDSEGQPRVCGWSEINNKTETVKIHDAVFSCGEILICMVTTYMPFFKRHSPIDTLFKFISSEQIHKFWAELQKRVAQKDKKFQFSGSFKELIEGIFLKKILTFDEILESKWVKNTEEFQKQKIKQILLNTQKLVSERIAAKKLQDQINEQKSKIFVYSEKKVLHAFQLNMLNSRSCCEEERLISDYYERFIKEQSIPKVEQNSSLRIQQTNPNFIIASLKDYLREENGKASVILCQQFVLAAHKVVKKENYALIHLDFALQLFEENEESLFEEDVDKITMQIKATFTRNNDNELYCDISVLQSNFCSYYTNLALRFLEDRIKLKSMVVGTEE